MTAVAGLLVRRLSAATVETASQTLTGTLVQHGDAPVVLQTADGAQVKLSGDEGTEKVLHDPRLDKVTLEAHGQLKAPGEFAVGPLYQKNLFVVKDGKRLRITYWCDVCSIRTYSPGVCVCCQKWTDLDLRDPNQE